MGVVDYPYDWISPPYKTIPVFPYLSFFAFSSFKLSSIFLRFLQAYSALILQVLKCICMYNSILFFILSSLNGDCEIFILFKEWVCADVVSLDL